MSTNEKKPKTEIAAKPEAKTTAQALLGVEKTMSEFEAKFAAMGREVRGHRETLETAQEERKRLSDQWDYEEAQRRRAVKDAQAVEDTARATAHAARTATLDAREAVVKTAVKDLLEVDVATIDRDGEKAIRDALDKKIAKAESTAKAIAESQAKKEYETAKKIADAETNSKIALLEAENARLKSDVAAAIVWAERVQGQYESLAPRMADLSRDAFQAAGGMTSKSNDALAQAAQGQGAQRRS